MLRTNQYQSVSMRREQIEGRSRDEVIEEYLPKVRLLASMMATKLAAGVEFEDLVNAGLVGLLDAVDKFDEARGIRFTTYAEFRIRGAILDSLRGMDLLSRTAREKANQLKKTIARLSTELRREPTRNEVAAALGMSLEQYYELLEQVKAVSVVSMDASLEGEEDSGRSLADRLFDPGSIDPCAVLSEHDFREALKSAIRAMPERLRQVLILYYYEELNFKEIGRVIGRSESRVCQLHTEGILRLRVKVERLMGVEAS